jgi:hypothetical protein
MAVGKGKRWGLIALVIVVALIIGGILAFHVAVGILKGKVEKALGSTSEIQDIQVGLYSVKVHGLSIKGPEGWPSADTLRAEKVIIVPSLSSIFSGQYRVRSITIVKPYFSVLRTRDGKFLAIPSLFNDAQTKTPSAPAVSHTLIIGHITLQDGVVELFDATVANPPLKIRLEQIQSNVQDVIVPALKGKSKFELKAVVKGIQRDGQVNVTGWAEIATKNSSVKTRFRSVDLLALEPYLIKTGEAGVQRGTLDLDMKSVVNNNRLNAPGKITISNLDLANSKGEGNTFMGIPRDAMVTLLMSKGNKITVDFILEGDINNPEFSINEALSKELAFSMAKMLGINFGGIARNVGTLGQKGGEATIQTAKGAGSLLRGLFGRKKK